MPRPSPAPRPPCARARAPSTSLASTRHRARPNAARDRGRVIAADDRAPDRPAHVRTAASDRWLGEIRRIGTCVNACEPDGVRYDQASRGSGSMRTRSLQSPPAVGEPPRHATVAADDDTRQAGQRHACDGSGAAGPRSVTVIDARYQMFGTPIARCMSLATRAPPVAVFAPSTAQLLLPRPAASSSSSTRRSTEPLSSLVRHGGWSRCGRRPCVRVAVLRDGAACPICAGRRHRARGPRRGSRPASDRRVPVGPARGRKSNIAGGSVSASVPTRLRTRPGGPAAC